MLAWQPLVMSSREALILIEKSLISVVETFFYTCSFFFAAVSFLLFIVVTDQWVDQIPIIINQVVEIIASGWFTCNQSQGVRWPEWVSRGLADDLWPRPSLSGPVRLTGCDSAASQFSFRSAAAWFPTPDSSSVKWNSLGHESLRNKKWLCESLGWLFAQRGASQQHQSPHFTSAIDCSKPPTLNFSGWGSATVWTSGHQN